MGTRTRTILPRCRRPRRTRAPRPATAPLLPTAWLPGASRVRGPTSSQPLRVSGAWRKCAASSPLFKVGVSSFNHVFFLFLPNFCAHPCSSYAPAFFFLFVSLLRLWRAGRPVPLAGNWRSSSSAAARGPPHLHHEHQTGPRPQDLCLHQHTAWVMEKEITYTVLKFSLIKNKKKVKTSCFLARKKTHGVFEDISIFFETSSMWRHGYWQFTSRSMNVWRYVWKLLLYIWLVPVSKGLFVLTQTANVPACCHHC